MTWKTLNLTTIILTSKLEWYLNQPVHNWLHSDNSLYHIVLCFNYEDYILFLTTIGTKYHTTEVETELLDLPMQLSFVPSKNDCDR